MSYVQNYMHSEFRLIFTFILQMMTWLKNTINTCNIKKKSKMSENKLESVFTSELPQLQVLDRKGIDEIVCRFCESKTTQLLERDTTNKM